MVQAALHGGRARVGEATGGVPGVTCVLALAIVGVMVALVGAVGFFVLWPLRDLADFDGD